MRKIFAVMSFLVVAGLLLSACGNPTGIPAPTPQTIVETVVATNTPQAQVAVTSPTPVVSKPTFLRINLGTYPNIIDPQRSSEINDIANLKLIYEGLTKFNEKLETVPGAAEKWSYNTDGTVLTFTLRKDLKYSDGSLLNAKRFEYSLKRNIDPATTGGYATITDAIKGAPEWRGGDAAAKAIVNSSVKATHSDGALCNGYTDAACNTLTLIFSKPAPYFHTIMGMWVAFPAKQENIETGGENWWNNPKFQIGNGPYILKIVEPSVRGYFVPNPSYWAGVANLDIEFNYITDTSKAFAAYTNNQLDIIAGAASNIATIKADAELSKELLQYPGSCTNGVMFNQLRAPFNDQKVREAFAMAFDRDAWVSDVLKGIGMPTLTWIPNGYPGYKDNETRWAYDPNAAKAALAASTYGSADKLPPIELVFSDSTRNRTRFEWLAAKWKEVLGVDVKTIPTEPTAYTALTQDVKTAPLVFILDWCASYPDPQDWLSAYWRTGGSGRRFGYANPNFDKLIIAADMEINPTKRAALYQQAQDALLDSAPSAFGWNTINSWLVKPWVKGIQTTPQDSDWAGSINPSGITLDTSMMP
jgi:oligopeptide transport system substrate-binding protein